MHCGLAVVGIIGLLERAAVRGILKNSGGSKMIGRAKQTTTLTASSTNCVTPKLANRAR
jgi:predicted nucleic acid-binding protein